MILILALSLLASTVLAKADTVIQTDIKFLCEINKIEKSLSHDKSIDPADLAERIYSIKEAGLRDKASRDALKAISTMAGADQSNAWKQFAKDNKIKGLNCL